MGCLLRRGSSSMPSRVYKEQWVNSETIEQPSFSVVVFACVPKMSDTTLCCWKMAEVVCLFALTLCDTAMMFLLVRCRSDRLGPIMPRTCSWPRIQGETEATLTANLITGPSRTESKGPVICYPHAPSPHGGLVLCYPHNLVPRF